MRYVILALVVSALFLMGFQDRGSFGQYFNKPVQFYVKKNPTPSTANDTTTFFTILGASDIVVYGSADDSCAALIYYRLRQNVFGSYAVTTAWTAIDTLGPAGDGTMGTTTGAAQRLGTISGSTLVGYNEIQFYVDYLTGTSNGAADGTDNNVRFLYYYAKRENVK